MKRIALIAFAALVAGAANAAASAPAALEPTAADIVDRNIAARGGIDAWRKVDTMVWIGHIESASVPAPKLPFVLEMKRPNKTRFEIGSRNQEALRVFDGNHGWKVHPAHGRLPQVLPYTDDELSYAREGTGIDGPLMDYRAKGIAVTLDGIDQVEGRKAYRLNVTLPSGDSHHVWIDADTYLDVKYDRRSRNAFGMEGTMFVVNRNYQTIEGLRLPLTIESGGDAAKVPDRMVIERILVNAPLEARQFAKPHLPGRPNTVTVDTRMPATLRGTPRPARAP